MSSSVLPSLATVCERLREMCGMNLDWRKLDFSFFGVEVPWPSSESLRVSLLLLMRKKFLMRCETWLFEPLTCLLLDRETPEKVRFSVMLVWVEAEELKSCVIAVTQEVLLPEQTTQRHNVVDQDRANGLAWVCEKEVSGSFELEVVAIRGHG